MALEGDNGVVTTRLCINHNSSFCFRFGCYTVSKCTALSLSYLKWQLQVVRVFQRDNANHRPT
ncbi:Uncharacterised protein [Vibrio cholerae]|nr:Uncharacterised protein [Vibrio cholerae]